MANDVGRPKKTLDDIPSDWKESMLAAYSEGKSNVWVRARLLDCISDDLWYRFIEEEPEFSRTVKAGLSLSQAYWEDLSQDSASGTNTAGNATSLIFNMKNRFSDDWREKQEIEHTGTLGLAERIERARERDTT